MAKEIVISADKSNGTTRIALVENGELVELHVETPHHERTLGDIALGKVKKVMPSIRAAFVDIGQKQDAFLHYSDLSDNLPQQLAFVAQDKPEIASIRIKRQVRLARIKRHRVNARRIKRKGSIEEALDKLFATRRRAIRPRPVATGSKKAQLPAVASTDRPEECLQRDQRILVKIVKEPISSKGSRVSTDISLAGRFLVLVPLADYVAVSKKISSYKERRRLRALARSLVPDGFGVIVRTQAEGKNARALDTDLRLLVEKWRKIEEKLAGKPKQPLTLHEDVNMVSSMIRDLFSDDYDRILIDDQKVYRNVKSYVQAVAPSMADAVQLYEGSRPVFETSGLQAAVRNAFESRVSLPTGGYLFFERTEAMHVVDVNSGRSGRGLSQEENSLRVNLEAARAIALQMRLRDLGGIICVDFIDLRDEKNRRKVYEEFKKEFRKDRAVTKLLPMSDFGVMEITRQRLRPALTTLHTADEVAGDGGVMAAPLPPIELPPASEAVPVAERAPRAARAPRTDTPRETPDALVARMGQYVADYKAGGGKTPLTLRVHPFLCAYLNRRVPNWPTRWSFRHLIRIRTEEDETMSPYEFAFTAPQAIPEKAELSTPRATTPLPPARRDAPAAQTEKPPAIEKTAPDSARDQAEPDTADTDQRAAPRGRGRAEGERDSGRGGARRGERGNERGGGRGNERRGGRGSASKDSTPEREGTRQRSQSRHATPAETPQSTDNASGKPAGTHQNSDAGQEEAPKRRRRRGGRNRRRRGNGQNQNAEHTDGSPSASNSSPSDG